MEKIDFKKNLKEIYNPSFRGFHTVNVPMMNFLMVDGIGNPNTSSEYQKAVETLYSVSYGIKFASKSLGFDHVVPPLEGLWWMEDMREFTLENKDRWLWTMMIMQPEWVRREIVDRVVADLQKKKKILLPDSFRFESFEEGLSVQVRYTGAYVDEGPTIQEMHEYIHANGYKANGKHHEIYLGDPRKTPAEKLFTILRQPIRKS